MNEIIKEIIKPPFLRSRGKTDGVDVCMKKSPKHRGNRRDPVRLFNIVRDNLAWLFWDDTGAKTYNQIIDWVVAALNEKYIRDFGEGERHSCEKCEHFDAESRKCNDDYRNPCPPTEEKHWEIEGDQFVCPKCNLASDFKGIKINDLLNCPRCKTRLFPPEQ